MRSEKSAFLVYIAEVMQPMVLKSQILKLQLLQLEKLYCYRYFYFKKYVIYSPKEKERGL